MDKMKVDPLEELRKAYNAYEKVRRSSTLAARIDDAETYLLCGIDDFLPALIAELEARRAQAGDIPNAAGFTPSATRGMK